MHYRLLKFYLKCGMKVTKIHTVYQFSQSPWLKQYIDFNTQQRQKAKSEFAKNLFKLIINAFFGKTMENVKGKN